MAHLLEKTNTSVETDELPSRQIQSDGNQGEEGNNDAIVIRQLQLANLQDCFLVEFLSISPTNQIRKSRMWFQQQEPSINLLVQLHW